MNLLEMDLISAGMNTSAGRSPAISRWTTRVVKHVNRATYPLVVAWLDPVSLEILMWYGPK